MIDPFCFRYRHVHYYYIIERHCVRTYYIPIRPKCGFVFLYTHKHTHTLCDGCGKIVLLCIKRFIDIRWFFFAPMQINSLWKIPHVHRTSVEREQADTVYGTWVSEQEI